MRVFWNHSHVGRGTRALVREVHPKVPAVVRVVCWGALAMGVPMGIGAFVGTVV
jgi:hypothetical protein